VWVVAQAVNGAKMDDRRGERPRSGRERQRRRPVTGRDTVAECHDDARAGEAAHTTGVDGAGPDMSNPGDAAVLSSVFRGTVAEYEVGSRTARAHRPRAPPRTSLLTPEPLMRVEFDGTRSYVLRSLTLSTGSAGSVGRRCAPTRPAGDVRCGLSNFGEGQRWPGRAVRHVVHALPLSDRVGRASRSQRAVRRREWSIRAPPDVITLARYR